MLGLVKSLQRDSAVGSGLRQGRLLSRVQSHGRAEVISEKVLPFGLVVSVTAFLRASLAIRSVGNSLLSLTWSGYFDDFLSLSENFSVKHTDMCVSALFLFLGRRVAEDKLTPFDSLSKILGVQLDLKSAKLGTVLVSDTQERVGELTEDIAEISLAGTLSKKDGERRRGRFHFATIQLFGRSMRRRKASGRKAVSENIVNALQNPHICGCVLRSRWLLWHTWFVP